ncbi:MAG: hypothetical protein IKO32_00735 [Lachnospiraceae bacterium]|nr:hypothetical protein [Lachnospiraceae bacterium]
MDNNNLFDKIKIAIFLAILIVPGIVFYIVCAVNPSNFKALTFDESENRNPAELPTIEEMAQSGDLIMEYYNDRVPYRWEIIKFYRKMNGALETPYRNDVAPVLAKALYVEPTKMLASNEGEESEISELDEVVIYDEEPTGTIPQDIPNPWEAVAINDGDEEDSEVDPSSSEMNLGDASGKDDSGKDGTGKDGAGKDGTGKDTTGKDTGKDSGKDTGKDNTGKDTGKDTTGKDNTGKDTTGKDTTGKTDPNAQTGAGQATPQTPQVPEPPQVVLQVPPAAAVESGDYFAPITSGQTLYGRDYWLFLNDGKNLAYYTGENILSNGDMAAYLQRMEVLNALCAQKGIALGFLICPDKNQVYTEYMPSIPRVNTYTRVHRFTDYVKAADPGLHLSYPLYELANAKGVGQPYYKYDTHWNSLGAFIGLQSLYANMGLPSTGLDGVGITEKSGTFVAGLSMLGNIDISSYPPDKDYSIYYRPDVTVTYRSGAVNDAIYVSTTDNPNGLKLALVGDSFREWMVPFVEKDFSQSTIFHRGSTANASAQIRDCNVLIVECVERYDKEMFNNLNQLIGILQY